MRVARLLIWFCLALGLPLSSALPNKPPDISNEIKQSGASTSLKRLKLNSHDCEYEKGNWEECKSNGIQQRTLRLKSSKTQDAKCERTKIVRRECKLAGCKYARGQWALACNEGLRVRVDTLVAGSAQGNRSSESAANCQPKRKVLKDCKRACHYVKSAWSECNNGFKTRNLTLQVLPGQEGENKEKTNEFVGAFGCAKEKLIRRECRSSASPAPLIKAAATVAAPHSNQTRAGVQKLTALQKRRLKQLQRQQPQQQR